jgi:hypothetical protein
MDVNEMALKVFSSAPIMFFLLSATAPPPARTTGASAADEIAILAFSLPGAANHPKLADAMAPAIDQIKSLNPGKELVIDQFFSRMKMELLSGCERKVRAGIARRLLASMSEKELHEALDFARSSEGKAYFQRRTWDSMTKLVV